MEVQFRNQSATEHTDTQYNVPIYRFQSLTQVPWRTFASRAGEAVRIIIRRSASFLPLDMLYLPRDNPDLLVGLHGAEFKNENLPKFQYLTSFTRERTESILLLSDSTYLVALGKIGIAWYSGTPTHDLASDYALAIEDLRMNLRLDRVVLVGHSAGGTGAIRIGAKLENSRAIAVNAQFGPHLYPKWASETLRERIYPSIATVEDLFTRYPERFDLSRTLDDRVAGSTLSWFSHESDKSSFDEFPNFNAICNYFDLGQEGGITRAGDIIAKGYWKAPENPHALPGTIIPFITATLGDDHPFALKTSVADLEWR